MIPSPTSIKRFVFPALILAIHCSGLAQRPVPNRFFEVGFMPGFNNYSGDLTQRPLEISETRLGVGVFGRYQFSRVFALNLQMYTGNISGADRHATDPELQARSLQFRSNLFEVSLLSEWSLPGIGAVERNGFQVAPYLNFGLGGVVMHPRVEYYGPPDEIAIRVVYPLPELGLGLHGKAPLIPFGGGLRARVNEDFSCNLEAGWRYVYSDYLDGVSLNGNPGHNDWYYSVTASIAFRLSGPR